VKRLKGLKLLMVLKALKGFGTEENKVLTFENFAAEIVRLSL
jgi:hypothetical protein